MSREDHNLDPALVRELATILNDTDLTEIEIERGSVRVRVSRQKDYPQPMQYVQGPQPMQMQAAPAPAALPIPATPTGPEVGSVPSPMVGTVYLASAPGAKNFVEVGQQVAEGETLLIIEAMKTMNQIPAPRAGKITRICVENAQPVEYGEALVVIA